MSVLERTGMTRRARGGIGPFLPRNTVSTFRAHRLAPVRATRQSLLALRGRLSSAVVAVFHAAAGATCRPPG